MITNLWSHVGGCSTEGLSIEVSLGVLIQQLHNPKVGKLPQDATTFRICHPKYVVGFEVSVQDRVRQSVQVVQGRGEVAQTSPDVELLEPD